MLGRCQRRWIKFNSTLEERIVLAGYIQPSPPPPPIKVNHLYTEGAVMPASPCDRHTEQCVKVIFSQACS